MNKCNIAIIGGGPCGIMAAIAAARKAKGVCLFEKNASLARKLTITGKGRCNLTNDTSVDLMVEKFGANGRFLRNCFSRFFVPDLMSFFANRGCRLKTERQGRVFPASDSSGSVVDCLKKEMKDAGVDVRLSSQVRRIEPGDQGFKIYFTGAEPATAQKIIIATGGASFPETGSTGDGFVFAKDLGHKVENIGPGLVPLETEEKFVKDIQGLTLKNIRLVFRSGLKSLESDMGELLFTHFGISGPLVLDMSAQVHKLLKGTTNVKAMIDLKPGLSAEQLDLKLRNEFQRSGSAKLKNYLTELLPKRLVDVFLIVSRIEGGKKCNQVASQERKRMVDALKNFTLTIKKTRPLSEAMVTCGGVSLKEVDPRTMESKKVKGVYFCGEVLDLAAASGGYNLQAAFSTGFVAGEAAALSL